MVRVNLFESFRCVTCRNKRPLEVFHHSLPEPLFVAMLLRVFEQRKLIDDLFGMAQQFGGFADDVPIKDKIFRILWFEQWIDCF